MNFCPTSTMAGITARMRRVSRVCAVDAFALSAVLRRSRRVSARFRKAVEIPPPARRWRRMTAAKRVNSAIRTRSQAWRRVVPVSSPASSPSRTWTSTGPTGFGASLATAASASRAGTPAPARRTIWSTISGNWRTNSASWRAWRVRSMYHAAPTPATPTTGIVHQSAGTRRNHRVPQPAAAPATPAMTAAGSACRASRSG